MSRSFKVVQLDLQDKVEELRAQGLGSRTIATRLSTPENPISYQVIDNYLKSTVEVSKNILQKKSDLQEYYLKLRLDVIKRRKKLWDYAWKLRKTLEEENDNTNLVKLVAILNKQIERDMRALGEIEPQKLEVTFNRLEAYQFLEQKLVKKIGDRSGSDS